MGFRRHRKRLALAFLVLSFVLSLLVPGCGKRGPQQTDEAPVAVELAKAELGSITREASATGTVVSREEVKVAASLPGRLAKVYVQVGDRVRAGDVVAELDNEDIKARLDQARAGLEQARAALEQLEASKAQLEANLRQAEAKANNDRANWERVKALYEAGAASKQQLEQAQMAMEVSQAQVDAARASLEGLEAQRASISSQVASAEAGVRQVEVTLSNTYIKAPVDGVVTARFLNPGEIAQGPIVQLATDKDIEVNFQVTEQDIRFLKEGVEVRITLPALGREFKGKISAFSPAADQRTRSYTVKAKFTSTPEGIHPGMTAIIYYPTERVDNVVVVPKNAVVKRGARDIVFTVEEGRAVGRPVVLGISDSEKVQIKEGLAQGTHIVVKGQDFLSEGQSVEVVKGE